MKLDIYEIMKEIHKDISSGNLIFANENQFQFELAWRIKEKYKEYDVLFEVVYLDDVKNNKQNSMENKNDENKKNYTDLVIVDNSSNENEYIAIELKYKTVRVPGDENYDMLKDQGAQGLAGYDYLKDLSRLEYLKDNEAKQFEFYKKYKKPKFCMGYAIILTNDRSYYYNNWQDTQSQDFTFHNTNCIQKGKRLEWKIDDSKKNNFGEDRQNPIVLKGDYNCDWKPVVPAKMDKYDKHNFYYLILKVCRDNYGN